ncbi:hypothetical protein HPB48_000235 [Haemaphysalis longicornis]|uniref:Uncharacterized protein n=1 Tax=Haemaphysalis longicornis TaxID=44386 RepID=A0A9J6GLU0_HAELO|nr:hypothetical protein HPB48_000235 [Haemaphysalis longicornis]
MISPDQLEAINTRLRHITQTYTTICVPFCLLSPFVGKVGPPDNDWVGVITITDATQLFDIFLMVVLGGIPWQSYFQRIVSCETHYTARMLPICLLWERFLSHVSCLPDFTAAGCIGPARLRAIDRGSVLPLTIHHLTPEFVSILGLIGITGAVMSSVDSSMLSAASVVTRNIYKVIIRKSANDVEVALILRLMVWAVGSSATYLALHVRSVLQLWLLCSEFVCVLLFPQLLCAFCFENTNAYGSLLAFMFGASFRLLCGELSINLPTVVQLPLYDEEAGQRFPFRLTAMCLSLVALVVGSYVAASVFENGWLAPDRDFLRCFKEKSATDARRDGQQLPTRSEMSPARDEPSLLSGADTVRNKGNVDSEINASDGGGVGLSRRKSEVGFESTLKEEAKSKTKTEALPTTNSRSHFSHRKGSSHRKTTGSVSRKAGRTGRSRIPP